MAKQSRARRLVDAEAELAAAIEAVAVKHGLAPAAFVVILANIPNDSGMFNAGRDPFLFRFRGHPSLVQKAAEWVAERLESGMDTGEDEDETETA